MRNPHLNQPVRICLTLIYLYRCNFVHHVLMLLCEFVKNKYLYFLSREWVNAVQMNVQIFVLPMSVLKINAYPFSTVQKIGLLLSLFKP